MKGTVLYGPRDIRFEDREDPKIIEPTDAILRLSATCVCGSDLWPYRGLQPIDGPTPMGHDQVDAMTQALPGFRMSPSQPVLYVDPAEYERLSQISPI